MTLLKAGLSLAGVLLAVLPALAVDLKNVDRTILKEPVYQTKPGYCLLVFGPEAKTRVWVVLDGDRIYVDRNANGDLTEEGECIRRDSFFVNVGDITELGDPVKHQNLTLGFLAANPPSCQFFVDVHGTYREQFWPPEMPFRADPNDAPVVHFNGPLKLAFESRFMHTGFLRGRTQRLEIFVRQPCADDVERVSIYTKAGTALSYHPIAEIEFPPRELGDEPIKVTLTVDQRR